MPERDDRAPIHLRRRAPGLALMAAYPLLRLAILILGMRRRTAGGESVPGGTGSKRLPRLAVFQAYQVGDCFMALPAIQFLSRTFSVTVLCRPDCVFLFRDAGIEALGLDNPFHTRKTPRALWGGFRSAWRLRGRLACDALDFDADPRTAFLLKAAGAGRTYTYARPFGWFFDRTFPLPPGIHHQSEKNLAVAAGYLGLTGSTAHPGFPPGPEVREVQGWKGPDAPSGRASIPAAPEPYFLLSCWTRKEEKNWPLEYWDRIVAHFHETGIRARILVPPDGDEGFHRFRDRWRDKMEFLSGDLPVIFREARAASGIVTLDNFLGHMGAHLGKPVFWINGSSNPAHVAPMGPGTRILQYEPMPCRPCLHNCVNPVKRQCLIELRPERVLEELRQWLPAVGAAAAQDP